MPTATQTKQAYLGELYERTAKQATNSLANWTGFLTTVGNLYKYPFHEQLMIYAQRPDATACAEYGLWNDKMNRYVHRGTKGIALMDTTSENPQIKYVFDVSDTGGRENSRRPFLWEMQSHHEQPILEMLEDKFGVSGDNLLDGFYNIAKDLAAEYYDNHKEDLPYLAENSFLEDYDEDNLKVAFENAATVSIAYTLMKRCGVDTENYFEHEDFSPIFDFNTSAAVSLLGAAVSEQSEQVFRQISLTIIKTEHERSNEHERNHLQPERGLSDTRPQADRAADTTVGQIRQNEENPPRTAPQSPIQPPVTEREAVPTSTGNRPNSHQANGADNGGLAENADTARQDDTADGMGGLYEQSESPSGGNDFDGTGVQLTLFPSEQEQIQSIADRQERVKTQGQSAFSMPSKGNKQLSIEPKQEDVLANWLVDFFNSLDTKYKGTFYAEKPELKVWEHISSKKKNLSIYLSSPVAGYANSNAFTYFNHEDKTDEIAINEAIYNSPFLSKLSKDKDFSITLSTETIHIYYHNFEGKQLDFSLAETFENTAPKPVLPLSQVTPLYQGYLDIKAEYPSDIVLYPVGSFYEVLEDDAKYAAETLDLHLTHRKIGLDDERVPMCGFPDHVLEQYTEKLLDSGRNVVLVSMEDGERKLNLLRSTAIEPTKENAPETATPELVAEITQADIITALQAWNGDADSKRKVFEYMDTHSRERGTAQWLQNEYGGNQPTFTVTKGDLSLELPWAKVQRHIGQLVAEDKFFTDAENDSLAYVDFADLKEQLQNQAESPFVAQVISDVKAPPQTENNLIESNDYPLTLAMYDTENPNIFKIKANSYLVEVDVNATQEIWERFADKGLVPKEDSEQRLIFNTDGKNWNRFIIPDKYGNKSNNISAFEVLTPEEQKTMLAVVQRVLPTEEKQAETTQFPYTKGDTVYLENGTPFLIEDITDHQVTLRDPSLIYPILRAESRESDVVQ